MLPKASIHEEVAKGFEKLKRSALKDGPVSFVVSISLFFPFLSLNFLMHGYRRTHYACTYMHNATVQQVLIISCLVLRRGLN